MTTKKHDNYGVEPGVVVREKTQMEKHFPPQFAESATLPRKRAATALSLAAPRRTVDATIETIAIMIVLFWQASSKFGLRGGA